MLGLGDHERVNRLGAATSPYLLQHADNPVDWWEWGPDAFAEARERGVPVLLSVGYAACHWCHVRASRLQEAVKEGSSAGHDAVSSRLGAAIAAIGTDSAAFCITFLITRGHPVAGSHQPVSRSECASCRLVVRSWLEKGSRVSYVRGDGGGDVLGVAVHATEGVRRIRTLKLDAEVRQTGMRC